MLLITLSFNQELALLLIDKLVIGALILLAGFLLNRILKRGELKQALENELQKLRQSFSNDLGKLGKSKTLEYAERQLSEFYWPLYVRWFTLNSLRKMRKKQGVAENRVKGIANQEVAIQNEMVGIIHRGIHLMEDNNSLFEDLRRFASYAASFQAELETVIRDGEPEDLSELWPVGLRQNLVDESYRLQKRFDSTVAGLEG